MKILKYKSDILAYISSLVIILGTFLPIVIIDGVSSSFITENGKLVLACAVIGVILYLFKVGFFSFIPAIGSLLILLVFYLGINDSMAALNTLTPGSAVYGIGFYLIIIGSVLLIISSIINFFDNKKYKEAKEVVTEDISLEYTLSEDNDQVVTTEVYENETIDNEINVEQEINENKKTIDSNIPLEDSIMHNLEDLNTKQDNELEITNEEIKEKIEQPQFKECSHCRAIIRIESKICSFCNSKTNDNNM